ncbi:MAG: cobalamin-dependent protein [Chloroflexota bacterium]|nr:cobalamin-dependent protein [Chloroflexota bacterium]
MRILLIATNKNHRLMGRMNAEPAPIGLAYIAGYLNSDRHQVKILDLMFSDNYLLDIDNIVTSFKPELIGISLRNLDNVSYMDPQWALPITKEVIDKLRLITNAPVVCGGPGFSTLPEACFDYLEPDLAIAGDGGESFSQMADAMDSGEDYMHLSGMMYRSDAGTLTRRGMAYSEFSKPPLLEQLDMARYEKAGFGIGVVTKLGDAFSNSIIAENNTANWRVLRPIEDVIDEVQNLKTNYKLKKIFFIDSGFNVPLPYAKSLCNAIIDQQLDLQWSSYLAPVPESCDDEVLELMKTAGSGLVIVTNKARVDTENESLEERLGPVREVCKRCDRIGINYVISQNFGEPGETEATVDAKLDFLRDIDPALANLRVGVRIRPDTPTADAAIKEGIIGGEDDLIKPSFYIAEPVREWLVEKLKNEADSYPRWNLV